MAKKKNKKKENQGCLMDILEMAGWFAGAFLFLLLSYKMPGNSFYWVLVALIFGYICYCDNSFIRKYLLKRLSKKSSLRKKIMKRKVGDFRSQVYKTLSFFCLWLNMWCVPIRSLTLIGILILSVLSTVRYLKNQDTIKYGTFDDKELSPTMLTMLVPGTGLLLFGLQSNMVFPPIFWILWGGCVLAYMVPFMVKGKEYKRKKSIIFVYLLSALLFTFGTLCAVNTDFDFSEPQEYRVKILDKWTSGTSRSRSYNVKVTPWGGRGEAETFDVSFPEYRDAEIGETAYIYEKEGFLKMEWYYIEIK